MALGLLTATDPGGNSKPMLLNGSAYVFAGAMAAVSSQSTNWIPVGNYISLLYIIQSDQAGSVSAVEYSTDGNTVNASGTARPYTIPNRLLQVALTLKDKYFRLTYTNGNVAATNVYFECKLSTSTFQNTMASAYQPTTMTNLASLTKAIPEMLDNVNGTYDQVYRTGNSMNVHVDNPSGTTDVSALAKDATLASILAKLADPATQTTLLALYNKINAGTINVEIANEVGNPITVSNTNIDQLASTLGLKADTAATDSTSSWSSNALLKGILAKFISGLTVNTIAGFNVEATQQLLLAQLQTINTDQGTIGDVQATNSTASWGEIALLKGILQRPATGTSSPVTIGATVTTLLAANPLRKGATIYSTNGTALILLGSGASASLYSARIITNGYYEVPFGYTGIITGFTSGTTLNVTELT